MNKFYYTTFDFLFCEQLWRRLVLRLILILLLPLGLHAQVPSVSYNGGSQYYVIGQSITPLTPVSSNVSPFGFATGAPMIFDPISYAMGAITADVSGNIYTLLAGSVKKIPPNGGAVVDLFSFPGLSRGIAVDASGNVYISEFASPGAITKITPAGVASVVVSGLDYPASLAIDQSGNIYFTEKGSIPGIKKIRPDGSIITVTTAIQNLGPMTVDKLGNIYVDGLVRAGEMVYKIAASTTAYPIALSNMTIASSDHKTIGGLTVDNAGNLYVVQSNNIIYRIVNGVKTQIGTVNRPSSDGVAVDPSGNILVSTQGRPLGIMQVQQNGGYYINPALPAGLKFDTSTGTISGTPVIGNPLTNYTVTAYNNSGGHTTTVVSIGVPTTRYVKAGGTGLKDGSSWANASDDLQLMINNSSIADEVWVAGGTYIPNRRADNTANITAGDKDDAFVLKADVKIYGGFGGTESSIGQRDLSNALNISALSGDFNQNDVLGGTGATLNIANNGENAYHVVVAAGALGTAKLDGFTIRGGNANASIGSVIMINGVNVPRNTGGGIVNFSSSPVLSNIILTGNNSRGPGGGISNSNTSSPLMNNITIDRNTASPSLATSSGGGMTCINNSSPVLTNVVISNNSSYGGGGAYISDGSSPIFTNVIIRNNYTKGTAFPAGGGIYNTDNTAPVFTNVLIADNFAQENGGGMYNYGNASPTLTNVTIVRNAAAGIGGGMYSDGTATPKIRNSIVWDNGSGIVVGESAAAVVDYSLIQGGYAGTGNKSDNPLFANANQGDYTLKGGSPAIDGGNNAYFDAGQVPDLSAINTALNGNARKLGPSIDMGAYEFKQQLSVAALNFDGVDDKVVFPAPSATVSGSFTVMAWVRPTDATKTMHIVSTKLNGGYGFDLQLKDGNTIHSNIGSSGNWLNTAADAVFNYTAGRWMHLAYSVSPTGYQIYANGELVGSGTFSGHPSPLLMDASHPLQIGNNGTDNTFFKGDMDEVRIYGTALTQANIQADMLSLKISVPVSLIARYGFDDGVPAANNAGITILADNSSHAYNGTLSGFALSGATSNWVESYAMTVPVPIAATDLLPTSFTANWSVPEVGIVDNGYVVEVSTDKNFTAFVGGSPFQVIGTSKNISGLSSGQIYYYRVRADKLSVTGEGTYSKTVAVGINTPPGSALNFDGIDDYISVAAQSRVVSGAFTVMAWVRPTLATKTMHIFSTRESGDQSFDLQLVGGNKIHGDIGSGGSWITTSADANYNYPVNKWTHIAYSVSSAGYKIYANGIEVGNGTFSGTPLLMDGSRYITIGKNATENTYFQGNIDEVRVYGGALSDADIQADMESILPAAPANLIAHYSFDQAGGSTLTDQGTLGYNGTLNNFGLSGQYSNWVESYAMVVPALGAANVSSASFTANWSAPTIGTLDDYVIDVASNDAFTTPVSGSPFTVQGTSTRISGLSPNTAYYYRVSADKSSVTGQGAYTATAKIITAAPNANLSALLLSDGTLSPVFSASILSYTVGVSFTTSAISITPTAISAAVSIEAGVNGNSSVSIASGSASSPLALNVGNNTIVIKVTDEDGVTIKNYTITITRAPGDQTIAFATLTSKVYGDADFSLTATGGASGNPVTFQSSNTAVATVNGNLVTIVGAGTTTITASQTGNANYNPALDVTQDLVVDKAVATVTLSGLNAAYDGSAKSVIVTTNPVGLSGVTITYDGLATAPTAAGTYAVVASLNNPNYTAPDATGNLVIGKATASIALSGLAATYDGAAKSVTATTNPVGLPGISITYDGLATAPTAAGTYAVVASLNNPNYSALDATGNLVIGKATASIALSGLSATYDGTAKSVIATTNPVGLPGISITYDGLATAPTAAGTYAVVASLNNPNYSALDARGNLVIGKATASIALSGLSATYDGTAKSITVTTNPVGLSGVTITYDGSATAPTAAGTYAVVASLNNPNYSALDATGNLVIGKATASIALSGLSSTYDGSAKSVVATTNPVGLSGVTITYDGLATAPTAAGTYAVVASLNNPNYTSPDATGNLVIGKATASIALSGLSSTYDGSAKSVVATTNPVGLPGISITYDGLATAPTAAGTYAVVASLNNPNYSALDATGNLVIGKATASIALSGLSATYDGTSKPVTAATNPTGLSGVTITYDGLATAPTAAGTYAVVASLNNPNYTSPDATGDLVIGKAIASIALSGLTATYDGTSKPVTTATNPTGLSGVTITYDGLATAPTAAGTYVVVASLNNSNYTSPDATGNLVIGKATASITLSGLIATYDGTSKPVTATTNPVGLSGISITYDGSTTVPTAAGTYAVVASLNNSNYTAPDATGNLVIGKAAASIALSGLTATYDGTSKPVTATTNPVGLSGISITYDGSATVPTAAGTYAVVASLNNSNYTAPDATGNLMIGKATASIALSGLSTTYDGTSKSVTATTNPVGLSGVTITYDGLATAPTVAGTYAVVASLNNPNYTSPDATGNLVISRKSITITADAKTKTFGDADPALTYQITGTLISPDMIIGSLTRNPGENPGAYAITQGSLALNNNYNLIYVGANLTIENSKISFPNLSLKTYGDADFDPGASSVNTTKVINYSSDNSKVAVIASGKIRILSAGTANITASQEGAASVTRTLTVSKASLKVTANHQSRIYGTANPELTVVYSGFVNGDDVTKLTIAATTSTVATIASVPGDYPIKVSGAMSENYDFIYVNGILTVTPFSNADLINLTISSGTLSPLFAKETRSYTASVAYDIDHLVLTLTISDANATVRINGSTLRDVPLNPGNNTISVEITAQDKITKNTYVLNVYRGVPIQSITATNILTPNNDGKNDTWVIQDIELYPNNKVTVYDRAGRVVYTKHGYTNDWGGTLNGTGSTLVEGTYYYIVDLGIGKSPFKGFITIIGNR